MGWTSLSRTKKAERIVAFGFPLLALLVYLISLLFTSN
jgi:hypothetical protein